MNRAARMPEHLRDDRNFAALLRLVRLAVREDAATWIEACIRRDRAAAPTSQAFSDVANGRDEDGRDEDARTLAHAYVRDYFAAAYGGASVRDEALLAAARRILADQEPRA